MKLIDFHCHVLPCVDDGPKSLEESISLLQSQKAQGIDTVVATPHFVKGESFSRFLKKREEAYNLLMSQNLGDTIPNIVLGAEVYLYYGLADEERLNKLCIGDTDYILIEPPTGNLNNWESDEIFKLASRYGLKPILAHIDRYMRDNNSLRRIERLIETESLVQVNAEAFDFFSRKKVRYLKKRNAIAVLGSDCHNMEQRPCKLLKAYKTMGRMFGKQAAQGVMKNAELILQNKQI